MIRDMHIYIPMGIYRCIAHRLVRRFSGFDLSRTKRRVNAFIMYESRLPTHPHRGFTPFSPARVRQAVATTTTGNPVQIYEKIPISFPILCFFSAKNGKFLEKTRRKGLLVRCFHPKGELVQSHNHKLGEGRFRYTLKVRVISHNKVCLTNKCTINEFVVIVVLRYQIQVKIWILAKNIPGTRYDFHKQFRSYRRCFLTKDFFILKNYFC